MIGIVLAGGESRRFGSPKAFATYEGRFFYEYAVDALAAHCTDVVLVARPEHVSKFPESLHVVTDLEEYAGLGPLAGILTAMQTRNADWYAVLPCDAPFVDERIIPELLFHRTGNTSVAMKAKTKLHPLFSIWSEEAEPGIRAALETGNRSVRPLVDQWIDGEALLARNPFLFDNVNSPGQLEGR